MQQYAAWLRAVDCKLSQNHPDRLPKEISLRSYAAEVLLDLHNETWNDDAEIDCKTFVGMMLEVRSPSTPMLAPSFTTMIGIYFGDTQSLYP